MHSALGPLCCQWQKRHTLALGAPDCSSHPSTCGGWGVCVPSYKPLLEHQFPSGIHPDYWLRLQLSSLALTPLEFFLRTTLLLPCDNSSSLPSLPSVCPPEGKESLGYGPGQTLHEVRDSPLRVARRSRLGTGVACRHPGACLKPWGALALFSALGVQGGWLMRRWVGQ